MAETVEIAIAECTRIINARQWDEARERCVQLYADHPDDVEVLNLRAIVAAHDQDWLQAEELWTRVHKTSPDNVAALLGLADVESRRENWATAASWARRAAVVDSPHVADARQRLTIVLSRWAQETSRSGQWDAAKAVAEELLVYVPDSPVASHVLGLRELAQDSPAARAERWFRKSMDNAVSDSALPAYYQAQIRFSLGDALYRQGKFEEALPLLFEAFRMLPDDANTKNGVRNVLSALLNRAREKRDWPNVKEYCEDLLAVFPDHHAAWNVLGLYHLKQGNFKEACESFKKALRCAEPAASATEKAHYAGNLGWTWMRLRRYGRADRAFRAASGYDADAPDVRLALQVRRMQRQYDSILGIGALIIVGLLWFH